MHDTANPILVVDDDHGHLTTLKTIIQSWGYEVRTADDGAEAVAQVKNGPVDLIVMDVRMANLGGIEALKQIRAYNPAIAVIIMTAYSSVQSAVAALKAGAYDYLIKPLDFEVLKMTLERAREHIGLKQENRCLKARLREVGNDSKIIGTSPAMKEMLEMLAMVAPSEATVLINGPSGTGKELIARSIHQNSSRANGPWVVVNCAAMAEGLLESELFGHEKGAFTGAERRRDGRFLQAHTGTLFLDEVGETSPVMQAKLLRVIQEREIQRVGGADTIAVDVRILAATNRDLEEEVRQGRFRQDLFFRLNVVTLNVPPLHRRRDDIPLLAQHFLERFAHKNRKKVKGFAPLAMEMLIKYAWPGNVRELENAVERAVILLIGEHITDKELPLNIVQYYQREYPDATVPAAVIVPSGSRPLVEIEKEAIINTLSATQGNKSETARRLGITRKTLHNKLKSYGI
jgi:two-component system response regulator HydG